MKVTLITHSSVLIECEHHLLLFDFYGHSLDVNTSKPLYIFSSHAHGDHYSSSIFAIPHPNKHYILSDDIPDHKDALMVAPHHTYLIDDIHIQTLSSTDQGVAFLLQLEGKTIYFAGDLNWWHWNGEPDRDNLHQRQMYLQEIDTLKEKFIDLACIVVDDRQEEHYLLGLQAFMNIAQAHYILPIHYFGHYQISSQLKKECLDNPYHSILLYPEHDDDVFYL